MTQPPALERLPAAPLVALLRDPARATALDGPGWARAVALARGFNLAGALAETLHAAGVQVPGEVQRHLQGARQLGARQRLSVAWEVRCIAEALQTLDAPVLLLKGAAYVMGHPALAAGRLFGDIDLLVPRETLVDVENLLTLAGWSSANTDAYDQRYYRQWMHELPPLVHVRRGTVVDVHHTILPLTARRRPDPLAILARARPLAAVDGAPLPGRMRLPAPEDLLAHSITHLLHEGELHNGLRDLHDIHRMVALFGAEPGFWPRLSQAARGNDLGGPVAQGLCLAHAVFGSAVPADWLDEGRPALGRWRGVLLRALLSRPPGAVRGASAVGAGGAAAAAAHQAVYWRGHALRMPLPQLSRHLARKAWRALRPPPPATTEPG